MLNKSHYNDKQGNIAEFEHHSNGEVVVRLIRPGVSNTSIAVSSDLKVGVLRDHGRCPDVLYDRFEGSPQAAQSWLASKGFS